MSLEDLRALAGELFAPERMSIAGVGPDERVFASAIEPLGGARQRSAWAVRTVARDDRVAVAGAAGRMGETVCGPSRAPRTWSSSAAPTRCSAIELDGGAPDAEVVVDFTRPDTALANALSCLAAGVHVVDRYDGL